MYKFQCTIFYKLGYVGKFKKKNSYAEFSWKSNKQIINTLSHIGISTFFLKGIPSFINLHQFNCLPNLW